MSFGVSRWSVALRDPWLNTVAALFTLWVVRARMVLWTIAIALVTFAMPVVADAGAARELRTAVVPAVKGELIADAYRRLHAAGFRVSIPEGFELDSLASPVAEVLEISPHPNARRPRGSIVTVHAGCECMLGSPAVPVGRLPRYRIPDFAHNPVGAAQRWIDRKTLYLTEHIGPLDAGDASSLYGNYRIHRQQPRPGRLLSLGIGTYNVARTSGTFMPLTVWADQIQLHPPRR
jgi:hypothetical protein